MQVIHFFKRASILIVFMAWSGLGSSCNNQHGSRKFADILQAKLDSIVQEDSIPGITLSVQFENGDAITLASGFSDREKRIPMKPDQPMFSGSVGKTYVSATVMKLYEEGKIDIHRKAIDYLKDETWFDSIPNARDFTVEMLMNHTAGVPEYAYYPEIWDKIHENSDKLWTAQERLSVVFNKPPAGLAGAAWNYSDSHYIVLGLLIEKITGKPYYTVLNDIMLKPLKLRRTFAANKRHFEDLPAGYTTLSNELNLPSKVSLNNTYCFNPQLEWTGGGLVSSVSDLTKWALALYGGKVLNPETAKMVTTSVKFETQLFERAKYGLGCIIGETNGVTYFGHTGFVPGFLTFLQYIPEYRFAVAIQVNTDNRITGNHVKVFMNKVKTSVRQYQIKEAKRVQLN